MSHKQIYKQCKMEKDLGEGRKLVDVAWIPSLFAKINKKLSIKDKNDNWVDGWIVVEVGNSKDVDELELQRKALKRWEKVLGDDVRE